MILRAGLLSARQPSSYVPAYGRTLIKNSKKRVFRRRIGYESEFINCCQAQIVTDYSGLTRDSWIKLPYMCRFSSSIQA